MVSSNNELEKKKFFEKGQNEKFLQIEDSFIIEFGLQNTSLRGLDVIELREIRLLTEHKEQTIFIRPFFSALRCRIGILCGIRLSISDSVLQIN